MGLVIQAKLCEAGSLLAPQIPSAPSPASFSTSRLFPCPEGWAGLWVWLNGNIPCPLSGSRAGMVREHHDYRDGEGVSSRRPSLGRRILLKLLVGTCWVGQPLMSRFALGWLSASMRWGGRGHRVPCPKARTGKTKQKASPLGCSLANPGELAGKLRQEPRGSNSSLARLREDPPGVGNGSPLQCSCWGNPMDRGAWCYSPWSPKESNMSTKQGQEKALLFSCLYIFNFHLGLSGFLYLFFFLFPEYAFFHSVLHFLSLPAFQWLTVSTHCF